MTGKERIMTALERGTPDTVPIWELAFNEASIIKIASEFIEEDKLPPTKYIWDMDETEAFQIINALLTLVRELDLDGATAVSDAPMKRVDDEHFEDSYGVIHRASEHGEPYPVKGPINDASDLKGFKLRPWEDLDFIQVDVMRSNFPDKALCFMMDGTFYKSWGLRGSMENLLADYILNPGLARDIARLTTDHNLEQVEMLAKKGVDFIVINCDLAFNENMLMSPDNYDEFIGQYYAEVVAAAHEHGIKMVKHTDGMLGPLVERFIENGFDGLHPIQPQCMDIGETKREYSDRLCIMGNIDCSELLVTGTPEEVRKVVKETIEIAAPGGGYIISSSNTIHPGCKAENYIALVEAAREFGKYPMD